MGYGIEQATELKDCFPPDLDGGCCILVHPSAVHVSTVLDVIRMSFGCHCRVDFHRGTGPMITFTFGTLSTYIAFKVGPILTKNRRCFVFDVPFVEVSNIASMFVQNVQTSQRFSKHIWHIKRRVCLPLGKLAECPGPQHSLTDSQIIPDPNKFLVSKIF